MLAANTEGRRSQLYPKFEVAGYIYLFIYLFVLRKYKWIVLNDKFAFW